MLPIGFVDEICFRGSYCSSIDTNCQFVCSSSKSGKVAVGVPGCFSSQPSTSGWCSSVVKQGSLFFSF